VSDPRAIAQVTTAASALSGAGVTLDVSNASLFVVGQKVELYPPQHGDGAPLARAGQTVRFLISAKAGATLVGTMNTDGYADPPQVERGWLVDGRTSAGAGSGYATPSAVGIQDAMDDATGAGGGVVRVQGGLGAIAAALIPRSNVSLIIEPGTSLKFESALSTNPVLGHTATRTAIDAFTATVVENDDNATLASGGASLARGDLVGMVQYKTATVTTPIASPGLVNWANHALPVGTHVTFTGAGLPTGITVGTVYYVIAAGMTANVFEISATVGGAAINFTGTSSGTQTAIAASLVSGVPTVWQMMTVQAVAGNVLQFHEGFAYPYTTAWRLEKFTNVLENFSFEGEITNPDGNITAPAVLIQGCRNLRINQSEVEQGVVVRWGHNVSLKANLVHSDYGLPNGTNYALDVQSSSTVRLHDNNSELIQSDFSARLYHCTDVGTRGNFFTAGARLLTFDACRKINSNNDSGNHMFGTGALAGGTGLTFADSDPLVGFEPGRGVVHGAEFHNASENCVFFAAWLDMVIRDSDFRRAEAQSMTIAAGCTVKLHNVKRDVVGIGAGATVLITDDAWTTWTPTLTQSGNVIATANRCFYRYQGDGLEFEGELVVTNAGAAVALNNILVSFPVTVPAMTTGLPFGQGTILKGGAFYRCLLSVNSTTNFGFLITSETVANFAGAGGLIAGALVNTDVLRFHGRVRFSA